MLHTKFEVSSSPGNCISKIQIGFSMLRIIYNIYILFFILIFLEVIICENFYCIKLDDIVLYFFQNFHTINFENCYYGFFKNFF